MAQSQRAGVPQLVVLAPGPYGGRRFELSGGYMVVGREPACDIRFDDPHVSRTHAALQRHGSAMYVMDLGSSGGTFVNGDQVTSQELRSGDVIRFATVEARFEVTAPASDTTRLGPAQLGMPVAPASPKQVPVRGRPEPAHPAADRRRIARLGRHRAGRATAHPRHLGWRGRLGRRGRHSAAAQCRHRFI
jgi:pSer/pThr/pTyr-binding forkhead associated (FHA) protein